MAQMNPSPAPSDEDYDIARGIVSEFRSSDERNKTIVTYVDLIKAIARALSRVRVDSTEALVQEVTKRVLEKIKERKAEVDHDTSG